MKKIICFLPFLLTACINVSTSAAPAKWDGNAKGVWAISLIGIKKDINDCYYHLQNEEYDLFNVKCDAMSLGARLNRIINTYENQKEKSPELSNSMFIHQEFDDVDIAIAVANDWRAIDHMKGFIVSFALADTIINH